MGFVKDRINKKYIYKKDGLTINEPTTKDIEMLEEIIKEVGKVDNELTISIEEQQCVKLYRYIFKNMSNQTDELDELTDEEVLTFFNKNNKDIIELRLVINDLIISVTKILQNSTYQAIETLIMLSQNLDGIKALKGLNDKINE